MKRFSDSHVVEMKQKNLLFIAMQEKNECKYVVIFSQMCVHIWAAQ